MARRAFQTERNLVRAIARVRSRARARATNRVL